MADAKIIIPKKELTTEKTDENVTKLDLTKVKVEQQDKVEEPIPEQPAEVKVEETEKVVEKTEEPIIKEIIDEPVVNKVIEEAKKEHNAVEQHVKETELLPENVEKLISFMKETGGTVQDYARLNADYSNVDETSLLKEYYKKSKPHLDIEDVNLIIEDFTIDEEELDDRDVRKKKIAYKEEIAKAKNFLEETKSKYYDEIKLRPGVTQDQQKAMDFFNRYNKQQETAEQQHAQFKESTKELFNDNFEGFDIKVGEKSYKYNIQNRDKVAESQSNINNLVGKFLDSDGNVKDTKGYHKAMYAADNVDKIAAHFYEQGKADAVKEVVSSSKNLSSTKARSTQGEVFLNGFKVKAISGADSTKLRIKTKKFN